MLACNFTPGKIQRLLSRVVIIPFSGPNIQAKTNEQRSAILALKHLKTIASQSIGHFIHMGKKYKEHGAFEVDGYESQLFHFYQTAVAEQ